MYPSVAGVDEALGGVDESLGRVAHQCIMGSCMIYSPVGSVKGEGSPLGFVTQMLALEVVIALTSMNKINTCFLVSPNRIPEFPT